MNITHTFEALISELKDQPIQDDSRRIHFGSADDFDSPEQLEELEELAAEYGARIEWGKPDFAELYIVQEAESERCFILADFLEEKDLFEFSDSSYDGKTIEFGGQEYLVLTDEEADEKAAEYIRDTVWAFNHWFLSDHMPGRLSEKAIVAMQEDCEGANDDLVELIEAGSGMEEFVQDAIQADGRGHFISHYDGEEHEYEDYLIYRVN